LHRDVQLQEARLKLRKWYAERGPAFIGKRAIALLGRYGLTSSAAMQRIESCAATLADYGCPPTLPTPGRVVQRYPGFLRRLQNMGAEIAVHGYDHVELAAYPPAEARQQLLRAVEVFGRQGIEVFGFRCPYLSWSEELIAELPKGMFGYSSNVAIRWDVTPATGARDTAVGSEVLHRLYKPASALDTVCVPWTRPNLVEIPVCVPDDLELHDSLQLGPEGIAQAWIQILHQTFQRGELFDLLFHPELAERHREPFIAVLQEAKSLHPSVWMATLREISDWWQEKSSFDVATSHTPTGLHISFNCSERATVLVRGLDGCHSEDAWDGAYYRLRTRALRVPAEPRPFVGLSEHVPERTVSFLREQGYILDTGNTAKTCVTYIDAAILARVPNLVELVNHIEASSGPLVRYWRWPNGTKSAMCISGDLDAITLLDYASRLFVR
jgi:hypothetical protein